MRLLFILFTLPLFAQSPTAVKTWYNKTNESTYRFYEDRIIKEHFLTKKRDTFLLEPTKIIQTIQPFGIAMHFI